MAVGRCGYTTKGHSLIMKFISVEKRQSRRVALGDALRFLKQNLRIGVLVCLTFAASGCTDGPYIGSLSTAPTRAATVQFFDKDEVIALIPATAQIDKYKTEAAAIGFHLLEDLALDGLGERMLRFTYPQPLDAKGAIAALEALDATSTVGINHAYQMAALDGLEKFDYANDLMRWPVNGCRAQGPIGMLDTGIDQAALLNTGATVITKDFTRGVAAVTRHGTEVAAILTDPQRISGVTLYNATVVGQTTDGQALTGVDSIILALNWLSTNGVRVVNVSLTGPYNKLLDRGIVRATSAGMVIVAAVGNDGSRASPRYPAALDNVIAVTAIDANKKIFRDAVRGGHVDLAAPGVDIPVILSDGTHFVTGTSIAVPFVTARIATDPALFGRSPPHIRASLAASAEDLGPPGADRIFGSGLSVAASRCEN